MSGSVKIMVEHPSMRLSEDKRRMLFQVSSAEFAANGFKQASLNRIISEVGMSKSSFYHYFENKTDLFQQTLQHVMAPLFAVDQIIDMDALTAETLWPVIMQFAGEMMQIVNQSPDMVTAGRMFYRVMENPEERELTKGTIGEFTNWILRLIQRGQALGVFRSDLPESLLIDMIMALGMSMDRWMLSHWEDLSDTEKEEIGARGFDLFQRLLEPARRD